MFKFSELHNVNKSVADTLINAGFDSSEQLLSAAATPEERRELSQATGIAESDLLEMINRAEMARIDGIGKIYADLLAAAGVNTVLELSTQNYRVLHGRIKEVAAQHHVRRVPNPATIEDWVAYAKELSPAVSC